MIREALKLALEALERVDKISGYPNNKKFITAIKEALAQPVQPASDKLLQIIAATYQILGVYDAPAHVLDVLADPLGATQEQIDALLPFVQPDQEQLIGCVNHDCQKCKEMQDWEAVAADQALTIALLRSEAITQAAPQIPQEYSSNEPVAFLCHGNLFMWPSEDDSCGNAEDHIPLYVSPPKRTWTGLTDAEQYQLWQKWNQVGDGWGSFYEAINFKLKERNS